MFKLIGPVLIRQDLVEARANVTKRLEYISSERRVPRVLCGRVGVLRARRIAGLGLRSLGALGADAAARARRSERLAAQLKSLESKQTEKQREARGAHACAAALARPLAR